MEAKNWNITNIPDLQDLPWYQNQYGANDEVEKVDSILPVRKPIDVIDSEAAAGSSGAPDASDFRKPLSEVAIKTTSSSASTGGTRNGVTSNLNSNSGGTTTTNDPSGALASVKVNLLTVGFGLLMATLL